MDELSVVEAVRRDLEDLAKRDSDLARSALAASAMALARSIDDPKNSATSKSHCARSLIDTLDRLLEQAPPKKRENTQLDDLRAKRAARAQRSAAAKG